MNAADNIDMQSHRDPAELEREVDQQRARVERLLGAIEQKLSPGEVFDRVVGYGKDGGRQFASNLSHTVRANPLPTLMTAAGMLWLYAQKDRPLEPGDRDVQQGSDASIADKASDHWDSIKARTGHAAHEVSDATSSGIDRISHEFHHLLDDNPIALGAMGVAVGALIGAVLPSTDVEDAHLGRIRDQLVDRAREQVREVADPARSNLQ
jgi:hypothetical protein